MKLGIGLIVASVVFFIASTASANNSGIFVLLAAITVLYGTFLLNISLMRDSAWPVKAHSSGHPKRRREVPKPARDWFRVMTFFSVALGLMAVYPTAADFYNYQYCAVSSDTRDLTLLDWIWNFRPACVPGEVYIALLAGFPMIFNILQFPVLIGWIIAHLSVKDTNRAKSPRLIGQ